MSYVRNFDTLLTAAVGRLPKGLDRQLHWLGQLSLPSVWATALLLYSLVRYDGTIVSSSTLILLLIPLATISKFLFRRQRPPTIYAGNMRIKSYSFPSSHAYAAALGGGFFAVQSLAHGYGAVGAVLSLLIITIGVSRVYLGAHYPSDVVAGWLLGGGLLSITLAVAP